MSVIGLQLSSGHFSITDEQLESIEFMCMLEMAVDYTENYYWLVKFLRCCVDVQVYSHTYSCLYRLWSHGTVHTVYLCNAIFHHALLGGCHVMCVHRSTGHKIPTRSIYVFLLFAQYSLQIRTWRIRGLIFNASFEVSTENKDFVTICHWYV